MATAAGTAETPGHHIHFLHQEAGEAMAQEEAQAARRQPLAVEQQQQQEQQEAWRVRMIIATLFLVLGTCLLAFVLPWHIKYDKEAKLHYLDGIGLAAALWGAIAMVRSLMAVCGDPDVSHARRFEDVRALDRPDMPEELRINEDALNSVLGTGISVSRSCSFLALLGRIAGNCFFIWLNFASLPKRDPTKPLNESCYIASYVEGPTTMFLGLSVIFIGFACSGGRRVRWIAATLNYLGTYSIFKYLRRANLAKLWSKVMDAYEQSGILVAVVVFFLCVISVHGAVLSVLLKLGQVAYLTQHNYWTWSQTDWFRLIGFINALAGLMPDTDEIRIMGMFEVINGRSDSWSYAGWQEELANHLARTRGRARSVALMATLTAEDVAKILKLKSAEQV